METSTLLFAVMTALLVGVTFHACRRGNEEREVARFAVFSGPLGAGPAVTAIP